MNGIKRSQLAKCKRRIARRLKESSSEDRCRPMFDPTGVRYEMAGRNRGLASGGIGVMHALATRVGLTRHLDERLHLLKIHRPYHESDRVLNVALNVLAGGECLECLKLRRNDKVYMDALGTERIPDPTTAGDFCRRFTPHDVHTMMDIVDDTRLEVWRQQPAEFFDQAVIDVDGTLETTTG